MSPETGRVPFLSPPLIHASALELALLTGLRAQMLPQFPCGISAMQEGKYGPAETSTSSFLEPMNVTSCGKKGLCRFDQIKHSEMGRLYRCALNMTITIIKKKQRDEREGSGTSEAETEVMHPQAKEWGQL